MSHKKCKVAPKRRRDAMSVSESVLDVVYTLPQPKVKSGKKESKEITILATMAA